MNSKNLVKKLAPFIIVILLMVTIFAIRAETVNIGGITDESMKALYQDENGMPYFTEIDSYYNYRLTENYLETGHLGDTQVNGTDWDSLSTSPNGRAADYQPVIIILTALVYQFLNLFAKVSLTQVAYWIGPFIGTLAVIPAYYMVRKATGNEWGAIVAGVIAGAAPAYFSHTYGGFFDTDMFNVLLPLLIVLFLTEAVTAKKPLYKGIAAALSAGSLAMFSLTWSGYPYMVFLTIGTLILYYPASYLMDRRHGVKIDNKKQWFKNNPVTIPFVVFVILTAVLLAMTVGTSMFESISNVLGSSTSLQSATAGSAYPNVYVSVGEMQIPSFIDISNQSAGIFGLIFAVVAFVIMGSLLNKKPVTKKQQQKDETEKIEKEKKVRSKRYTPKTKKQEEQVQEELVKGFVPGKLEWTAGEQYNYLFLFVLLILWTVGLSIMLMQGTRFIEQFSVPIALLAGLGIGLLVDDIDLKIEQYSYVALMAVIMVLITAVPLLAADHTVSSQSVGSTEDGMYNTLTWIKANTPEDTVLASWWDFGHLFTQVADRQVVFDGGSQNNMRAYWIGNALQTSNENLSAGILRMLANSGEDASNTLDLYTNDTAKTVEILNKILPMDRTQANTELTTTAGLDQQQANSVLDKTHPEHVKPVDLILSSDMLSKAAWWSYFGTWNFQNQTSTHYSYYPGNVNSEQVDGKTFIFGEENGIVGVGISSNETPGIPMVFGYVDQSKLDKPLNMTTAEDKQQMSKELVDGTGNRLLKPHKLVYVENNQLFEKIVNNNSNMSMVVYNNGGGSYFTVLFDSHLDDSVFTKLFLEGGNGVTRFKMEDGANQPGVMVWNVHEYPTSTPSNASGA